MENFKKLIKTEIFNDIKKSKIVAKKIEFLFQAFVANKEVLEEVQNHFDNIISPNENFSKIDKNKISSLLKKYWLNAWLEKPLTQKDIDLVPRYFDTYTYLQQIKLNNKIKKGFKKTNLAVKDVPLLTIALASYKKGRANELKDYIHSVELISSNNINRIFSFLEHYYFNKKLINGTLDLFTKALSKSSPSIIAPLNYPKIYDLLKQPENDWINFINACSEREAKNMYGYTKNKLFIYKINKFTPLSLNSKKQFLVSLTDFFSRLRDFDAVTIEDSLKNVDASLKSNNNFFCNYMNKNFNIKDTEINSLFKCLDIIKNNFKKLRYDFNIEDEISDFDDYMAYIKNVTSVYYKNSLSEQLIDKKTTTKPLKI